MKYQISNIFEKYKNGNQPDSYIRTGDGKVLVATRNLGNYTLFARHIHEDTYLVARIEPVTESDSEKFRRQAKSPIPSPNLKNEFKYCRFQLLTTDIPKYKGDDMVNNLRVLTNCCSGMWNTSQATKQKTAQSRRSLESQWKERYRREKNS